jgi:cytochrome c oxidase subunit 2
VQPDTAGKFFFACDVFCGSGHEEMEGEIVVTE